LQSKFEGLDMPSLFCFGFGYCAQHLSAALRPAGWEIKGTNRQNLDQKDIFFFDGFYPIKDPEAFVGITHLLVSVPPISGIDRVLECHADSLSNLPSLKWVGYLSATSVYGDTCGAWVDEQSRLNPKTTRGVNRVNSESEWLKFGEMNSVPVQIFRLAGIYGPGRSVFDRIRGGQARCIRAPHIFFSRIHIDDIVKVLIASVLSPSAGAIYNLADDEPTPSSDVVEYAYRLLGQIPPTSLSIDDAGLNEFERSFYEESRRVKNTKIKEDLGVSLDYPNFRSGLKGILDKISKI
jgi:nucleoside-diphosphate-sugar epimerase